MAYLNWTSSPITVEVFSHPSLETQLTVQITTVQQTEIVKTLREVLLPGGGELRLTLSDEWSVFLKFREEGSRVLLAHPTEKEWVATVALDRADSDQFLAKFEGMKSGESLVLSHTVLPSRFSNLEWIVILKE